MSRDSWNSMTLCFVKPILREPARDGCLRDEDPEFLEKRNESHKIKENTKLVRGLVVSVCRRIGNEDDTCRSFAPEAEGSFKCNARNLFSCKCCIFDTKEAKHVNKTCVSCKNNTSEAADDRTTSEIDTKKRLIKTGIDMKTACSHLGIIKAHTLVEDSDMFELFEKDISKVKFPLESLSTFLPDDETLTHIKSNVPTKDASTFMCDENITIDQAMSFLDVLATLLKLLKESNVSIKKSHYEKILSPSTQDLAKNSRTHSRERLMKRGMRHAMDKEVPSTIEGTIGTAMHDS